jgi:hypothetical protein
LPADAFNAVCSQLQSYIAGSNYSDTVVSCDSSEINANITCDAFEEAGNFTMQFATTATFVMKLSTLQDDDDCNACSWNLRKTDSNTTFFIGEQFFTRFYTIFDNDNSRLGFGIYNYGAQNATGDDDY